MDPLRERGDARGSPRAGSSTKERSPTLPWPGTTAPVDQRQDPLDRVRPLHRVESPKLGGASASSRSPAKSTPASGTVIDDVRVRVGSAEVGQLEHAVADLDLARSSNVRSGGSMTTSRMSLAMAGISAATSSIVAAPAREQSVDRPDVPPDRAAGRRCCRRRDRSASACPRRASPGHGSAPAGRRGSRAPGRASNAYRRRGRRAHRARRRSAG